MRQERKDLSRRKRNSNSDHIFVIKNNQKDHDAEDNDNQLWRYDDGFLTNKKSGLGKPLLSYSDSVLLQPNNKPSSLFF